MSNPVIDVSAVSKNYQLGLTNRDTFQKEMAAWWANLRGRPNPNARVDEMSVEGNFIALDNVSFTVAAGETVGVIGRNGAGKSTLLKILSRVTTPDKGRISIRGRVSSLLEVGTGFHPELTGRENLYLNGAILGMTKSEIGRKFDEIVAFAEIERFIDTPVKRYSSGMYVRLAFAVAAHLEPEILIVDEVLAVGDHEFQKKCMGKMRDVRTDGRTVLFVSHNMTAVNSICSRSILLRNGKVAADGPSADVTREYLRAVHPGAKSKWTFSHKPEKAACVEEVEILDVAGGAREAYELTEAIRIRLKYSIAQPLRGASVGAQVISEENGETLVSLSDAELDLSRLGPRPAGRYTTVVEIPAQILNTGQYSLRIGISRGTREIFDVAEGMIFRIIDSRGIMLPLGFERKGSLTAIQRTWAVEHFPLDDA